MAFSCALFTCLEANKLPAPQTCSDERHVSEEGGGLWEMELLKVMILLFLLPLRSGYAQETTTCMGARQIFTPSRAV